MTLKFHPHTSMKERQKGDLTLWRIPSHCFYESAKKRRRILEKGSFGHSISSLWLNRISWCFNPVSLFLFEAGKRGFLPESAAWKGHQKQSTHFISSATKLPFSSLQSEPSIMSPPLPPCRGDVERNWGGRKKKGEKRGRESNRAN